MLTLFKVLLCDEKMRQSALLPSLQSSEEFNLKNKKLFRDIFFPFLGLIHIKNHYSASMALALEYELKALQS
jgi:hypothetical protein